MLVAYGTLYPFTDWSSPEYSITERIFTGRLPASTPDILVNFLVYLPFGLLLFNGLPAGLSAPRRLVLITVAGASLSFCLEYLQAYQPARVPSLLDLILNTASAFTGGLLALFLRRDTRIGTRLNLWRLRLFKPGAVGDLGLLVFAFWGLSQLTPLVPSFDLGQLKDGINPIWLTLSGQQPFIVVKALVYACQIAALSLLLERTLKEHQTHRKLFLIAAALGAVLLVKIPVISRSISLEAVIGLAAGLVILPLMGWTRRHDRTYAAVFFILAAYAIDTLRAPTYPSFQTHVINWIPFHSHLSNELTGFGSILDSVWPFLALCLAVQLSYCEKPSGAVPFIGGFLVFAFAFSLEWLQQAVPGRYPDMTTAILALMAWSAPWMLSALNITQRLETPSAAKRPHTTRPLAVTSAIATLTLAIGLISVVSKPGTVIEKRVDESREPTHAAPNKLPPVDLPGFRYAHPRLPAPSAEDILRLENENPSYLRRKKRAARKGSGRITPAIISAFMEPGSIDLTKLHKRLMRLKFEWRGHQQGKPLAIAYDWLYDQWSDQQRKQLRGKLIEGGEYIIQRIRDTRLSPYNVYLYNSPFQALMAISLAVYDGSPETDHIMRFTADFWKNKTLPVWRQIMGEKGGWHEGGEYVGIGIGKAVYQVPAMWRSATGEDLFNEPGIRGFLEFLIYRTRPDNTHIRMGDGAFHNKNVPDRIPLSIELQHAAAYSLRGCPNKIEPTAWPWGPFPDDSLCDRRALERLPLAHYFDGIGLLVARTGWDKGDTYVTFKVGDNFWSHSHLDQGAFTIYKGGALAIDSGVYSGYGSDHHLNYSYQTIAHNVVTVTDPDDTAPKPEKKGRPPRPIANDGGQRRVGSGWGVEAAPLDMEEWERKKDIYHTGSMLKLVTESDIIVAVADLAPAYTNRFSGQGTFSHRTHRVSAYVRTLGFDPYDDLVVIHDRVKSTNPDFSKHWLLHSIEKPEIDGTGFKIGVQPASEPDRQGGVLHGTVLLPDEPYIDVMGGRGFEFFVDGTNYDNEGSVLEKAEKRKSLEPGAWRVKVSPGTATREDRFLVVLKPTTLSEREVPRVRLLKQEDRYGCEIVGPRRTTRWWFDSMSDGPVLEVVNSGGTNARDFRVAKQPDMEAQTGFLTRLGRLFGINDEAVQ